MASSPSFTDLIAPVDPAGFFTGHWQRRPLHAARTEGVEALVSLVDVEHLLSSLSAPDANWIKLARPGSILRPEALLTRQGHLGLARIYEAYEAGYTVQLAKVHKRWPPIGELCRSVEQVFTEHGVPLAQRVGAHLHFTPRGGACRGPHHHTHDNLAVQIAGRKRWRLYAPIEPHPVEPLVGDLPRDQLGAPEFDLVLGPGEVLYVPRGFVHEACAEDGTSSLHVTLDITPYTWADLFSRMMREQARFRAALPVGSWSDGRVTSRLAGGFAERCARLAEGDGLEPALAAMLEAFLDDIDALPGRGLDQLHAIAAVAVDTAVVRRLGAFARVIADGPAIMLRFPGSGLRGPAALHEVLVAVAARPGFRVGDLPGDLPDETKVELVRELIREGFLEIARDGD